MITKVPLAKRLRDGEIGISELKERARYFGLTKKDNALITSGALYGCPVCYSEIPQHCQLVTTEKGNKVCDYCVPFIED